MYQWASDHLVSIIALFAVWAVLLYVFVFVPNFNDCRAEGKPLRMCLGYLVR